MEIVEEYLRVSARQTTDKIFAENVYLVLSNEFGFQMATEEMQDLVKKWAEQIYRESLLGAGFELTMGAIAGDFTPVFDPIKDTTTVKFLEDTDLFYMGKYVKRDDTAVRMQKKIIEEYIGVGRDFSDKKFVQGVADALDIERWQAQRIIRTTSNMSRNFASLRMMEQSEVIRIFTIVGPDDRLKCPWCRSMLGREFRVVKAIFRMRSIIAGGAENVPNTAPILVSSIPLTERDDGSQFIDMTDADLQAAGFDTPSYHPNCRDRTAAVIA